MELPSSSSSVVELRMKVAAAVGREVEPIPEPIEGVIVARRMHVAVTSGPD